MSITPFAINESLPNPSRLLSLPTELLGHIPLSLDRPSAEIFARTHSKLSEAAKARFRCDTKLWLSPHFGRQPIVGDDLSDSSEWGLGIEVETARWWNDRESEAHEVYERALSALVVDLMGGTRRRLRVLSTVRLEPFVGDGDAVYQLLVEISSQIIHLELTAPPNHMIDPIRGRVRSAAQEQADPSLVYGLESRMFDKGLTFPALTHITITKGSIAHYATIALLCNSSPDLQHLDIEMNMGHLCGKHSSPNHNREEAWLRERESGRFRDLSGFVGEPKIKHLRLACAGDEDVDDISYIFRALLRRVPQLERLSVEYPRAIGRPPTELQDTLFRFLKPVAMCQALTDLRWPGMEGFFRSGWDEGEEDEHAMRPWPEVRRLALLPDCRADMLKDWPVETNPEILYLDSSPHETLAYAVPENFPISPISPTPPISPTSCPLTRQPTLPVRPELVAHLLASPRLHTIHFAIDGADGCGLDLFRRLDELETAGAVAFKISSYRRGQRELIHIRLRTHWLELRDVEASDIEVGPQPKDRRTLYYTTPSGVERIKIHGWQDEPIIRYLTDLDGLVVPLEVVEEMRAVEGMSGDEWEKRGVEVGEAAWRVLADWEKGVKVEEAKKLMMGAGGLS